MTTANVMPYEIKTKKAAASRLPQVNLDEVIFGREFSDHMLVANYADGAWQDVTIEPFGPLLLSPATTALHYGQEIFEGLKAYKDKDGKAVIFRPYDNWKRMNRSAIRMAMPEIPEEIFIEGIKQLVRLDRNWIPATESASMYIRPFMFASDEYVGIRSSESYKFIVFCSPAGKYYTEPVKIKVEDHFVRAGEGGTGEAKCAGNYGASLFPSQQAQKEGYRQVLWTDGHEHKYVEECGTMNVFFVIGDKVITPALDGTILHGITRDTVLTLLRENEFKVEERRLSLDEIVKAYGEGNLKEVFGAGTAATIAPVSAIGFRGEDITLDTDQFHTAQWLLQTLQKVKRREVPDTHGWLMDVE